MQRHAFFASRGVDWHAVGEKRVAPPFRPRIQCDEDVSQFDARFTREPPLDSPVEDAQLAQISQSANNFFQVLSPVCLCCLLLVVLSGNVGTRRGAQGFSYVAPSVISELSKPWIEPRPVSSRARAIYEYASPSPSSAFRLVNI